MLDGIGQTLYIDDEVIYVNPRTSKFVLGKIMSTDGGKWVSVKYLDQGVKYSSVLTDELIKADVLKEANPEFFV